MRKLLILIILLLLNCLAFLYLKTSLEQRKTYVPSLKSKAFLVQKKDLILDPDETFSFTEYFRFISQEEPVYRYEMDDKNIFIYLQGEKYVFPYEIREKEKEIVETIVYRDVYIERAENIVQTSQNDDEEESEINEYEADYFTLSAQNCAFPKDSSLSEIIDTVQSYVHTNMRVTIDYSNLNTSIPGTYPVYLLTDQQKSTFYVEIF